MNVDSSEATATLAAPDGEPLAPPPPPPLRDRALSRQLADRSRYTSRSIEHTRADRWSFNRDHRAEPLLLFQPIWILLADKPNKRGAVSTNLTLVEKLYLSGFYCFFEVGGEKGGVSGGGGSGS